VTMNTITKTVRVSGASSRSIEDAVKTVLARASVTIEKIVAFELVKVGGQVDSSGVPESYEVTLDITFTVKESPHN